MEPQLLDLVVNDHARFGPGAVATLSSLVEEARGRCAVVVTDGGCVRAGVIDVVTTGLERAGVTTVVYDRVEPNPGTASIERGSRVVRSLGVEGLVVVAVGGGSSMDSAKVIALHATNKRSVLGLGYHDPDVRPGLPVIAIPTTAGTGAETNSYGVITDEVANRKSYVGHPSVRPVAAILDPELTLGLPRAATAATGVDALTHSLESLLSARPNPFAEAIALGVIRTIGEWLPRVVTDGSDLEARSRMLMASHLAGLGQASGTGVGAVHAIGHAIGTRGRLAHGTALAAVMPEVFETYLGVRDRELALAAVALGVASPSDPPASAARAAIDAIRGLLERVGQRSTLTQLGIGPDVEPLIVADAVDDAAILNSPRIPSAPEIDAILAQVRG
ncbi:MAG: iron-containing alcohol dehydrogenase family protein [Chloroflexota bacterium]